MNNILPGFIDSLPHGGDKAARVPMRRIGSVAEIAKTAAFLLGDGARLHHRPEPAGRWRPDPRGVTAHGGDDLAGNHPQTRGRGDRHRRDDRVGRRRRSGARALHRPQADALHRRAADAHPRARPGRGRHRDRIRRTAEPRHRPPRPLARAGVEDPLPGRGTRGARRHRGHPRHRDPRGDRVLPEPHPQGGDPRGDGRRATARDRGLRRRPAQPRERGCVPPARRKRAGWG